MIRVPQEQERYLTKDEVLAGVRANSVSQSQLNETYLANTQLHSQNTTMNLTLQPLVHCKSQINEFSMKKVMKRMKSYQKGWEKQSLFREMMVKKDARKGGKLKSILKDAEAFRDKMERKETEDIRHELENIQPSLWGSVLRSSQNMLELKKKNRSEEHLMRGLSTAGSSKFKKEMTWLEEKDRQGHFFRMQRQLQLSTRG